MITPRTVVMAAGILVLASGTATWAADEALPPAPPAVAAETGPAQAEPAVAAETGPAQAEAMLAYLPEVVATFEGGQVSAEQVKRLIVPQLAQMLAAGQDVPEAMLKAQVVQLVSSMVDQKLLLARAARADCTPDLAAARQKLAEIEAQIGSENYQRALQQQGVPVEQLLQQMAEGLAINRWVEEKLIPANKTADADVRKFYDENPEMFQSPATMSAAHILLRIAPDASAADKDKTRATAERMLTELKGGAEFAALARENSDCPSGQNGGDLGFFEKDQMDPIFAKAAAALKPGELSGLVETRFGVHIIKGGEQKPAEKQGFDEVKESLAKSLDGDRISDVIEETLKQARAEAKVTVLISATAEK